MSHNTHQSYGCNVISLFLWQTLLSVHVEEVGRMTSTAADRQFVIVMLWLQFWEAVTSCIFISVVQLCQQ